MKQTLNKLLIGILFTLAIFLVSTSNVSAQLAYLETYESGPSGGGGTTPTPTPTPNTTNKLVVSADINKSEYNPGEKIKATVSAYYDVCSNTTTDIIIKGSIVDFTRFPSVILDRSVEGGTDPIAGTANFTVPTKPGSYVFKVNAENYWLPTYDLYNSQGFFVVSWITLKLGWIKDQFKLLRGWYVLLTH